ncbi:MAG: hypothetical protein MHPSP_004692, partial [Paramarteilia canceri]
TENGFAERDFAKALKNKWIKMEKLPNKSILISRLETNESKINDTLRQELIKFKNSKSDLSEEQVNQLFKDKLLKQLKESVYCLKPGVNFSSKIMEEKVSITTDDIAE